MDDELFLKTFKRIKIENILKFKPKNVILKENIILFVIRVNQPRKFTYNILVFVNQQVINNYLLNKSTKNYCIHLDLLFSY